MRSFFLDIVLPLLGTFCLGVFGWLVTHFVGRQILELYNLRRRIHETLLLCGGIGKKDIGTERYYEMKDEVDICSVKLMALSTSASRITRLYFRLLRYNLSKANMGLILLSMNVGDFEFTMVSKHDVEKGLRLPLSQPDEFVDQTLKILRQRELEERER